MNRRLFCQSVTAFALAPLPRLAFAQQGGDARAGGSRLGQRVLLGVDYYPDQTPENLWAEDARRMAAAGVNNVRLAEFAWALMEPSEGQFQFDWLHRAVKLLHGAGIDCILGTPSAAPPQWLSFKYPEVLLENDQAVTMTPNSRRYTCPSNETYRRLSDRVATEMAKAFAREPGVIGWQIDNEFTLASYPRCYCKSCRAGFEQWTQKKYGSLAAVNEAWGTSFWSQVYTDWAQIPTPLPSDAPPNPGYALDYDRYESAAYAEFSRQQLQILRENCPWHFVTHNNVAGLADTIDLREIYKDLDFASADSYPAFFAMEAKTTDAVTAPMVSFTLDAMRWTKQGEPFLVMEEQSGKSGQPTFSPQPQKGQVRLWTYQAVAHGAMGVNYFRWDTARFGAEEYWHGLLNHDRTESPEFAEVVQTYKELKALPPELLHAPVRSEVAVSFDPICDWAVTIQPGQAALRYGAEVSGWYAGLHESGYGLDVVNLGDDLQRYKAVFVPLQYVLSEAQARNVASYVRGGGTLVLGYRSGVKTETNQIVDMPRPGLLREVLGVTVADYVPVYTAKQMVRFTGALAGADADCEVWYDVLQPDAKGSAAEVLATYTEGDAAGKAAITRHAYGKGQAYYMGPRLGTADRARLLSVLAAAAGAGPVVKAPGGVEATERVAGGRRWLFLLNHTPEEQQVTLPSGNRRDLLGGGTVSGSVRLPRYGVAVLEERA